MGGTFAVKTIRDPELLKKYADFVRCEWIDLSNRYLVTILKGRRNRQLPCIVDPEGRPRICHILDNEVHVHQYGQAGILAIVELSGDGGALRDGDKVVILPLPGDIADIIRAADIYLNQHGVVAQLTIRGTVKLAGGQIVTLPTWRPIARFDRDLGLIGLGEPSKANEELRWVYPLGPGNLKIEALEEEHEAQHLQTE